MTTNATDRPSLIWAQGPVRGRHVAAAGLTLSAASTLALALVVLGSRSGAGLVAAIVLGLPCSLAILAAFAAFDAVTLLEQTGEMMLDRIDLGSRSLHLGQWLLAPVLRSDPALRAVVVEASETLAGDEPRWFRLVHGPEGGYAVVPSDRLTRRQRPEQV